MAEYARSISLLNMSHRVARSSAGWKAQIFVAGLVSPVLLFCKGRSKLAVLLNTFMYEQARDQAQNDF